MEKNYVKSFKCYFLSMLMTTSLGLAKVSPVNAEDIRVETEPKLEDELKDDFDISSPEIIIEKQYLKSNDNFKKIIRKLFRDNPASYTVKKGNKEKNDNLSRISRDIVCKAIGVEKTTKYWPVLAFINGFPKTSQPGDKIYYINSKEGMEIAWQILKTTGWYANYVQRNGIYKDTMTISDLVKEIYGIDDDELVILFLAEKNLLCEYDGKTEIKGNLSYKLTESIPTLDDLGYIKH